MKKMLCLLSTLAFFAACDDSGTSGETSSETSSNESSKEKTITLNIRVDSWSMLPNCTETRNGEYAFVTKTLDKYENERDTYSIYKCGDGKWILNSQNVVPSLDDLLSSCRESVGPVMVLSEEAFYHCDGDDFKWIKLMDFPKDLQKSSFSDSRDGQIYKTVKIGDQVWMAENLNHKTDGSFCFNDSAEYCAKYGRLYSWEAAMNACPPGWHLPDTNEFKKLFETVNGGINTYTGYMLVSGDSAYFGPSYDPFGFSGLPAGRWRKGGERGSDDLDDAFYYGECAFWSSTEIGSEYAYFISLADEISLDVYYRAMAEYELYNEGECFGSYCKRSGFSVRCLRD